MTIEIRCVCVCVCVCVYVCDGVIRRHRHESSTWLDTRTTSNQSTEPHIKSKSSMTSYRLPPLFSLSFSLYLIPPLFVSAWESHRHLRPVLAPGPPIYPLPTCPTVKYLLLTTTTIGNDCKGRKKRNPLHAGNTTQTWPPHRLRTGRAERTKSEDGAFLHRRRCHDFFLPGFCAGSGVFLRVRMRRE